MGNPDREPTPEKKFCWRCGAKLKTHISAVRYNEYTGEPITTTKIGCSNSSCKECPDYYADF